ncbi:hypothetical protein MASR1M12_31500 [Erysipelotrichia bacterium]
MLREARALGYRDILVYSGFSVSTLKSRFSWLQELVDALVDGPYEREKPTDDIWRGSGNQTLHLFTRDPDIVSSFSDWQAEKAEGKTTFQMVKTEAGIALVGIPKDEQWKTVIHQTDQV